MTKNIGKVALNGVFGVALLLALIQVPAVCHGFDITIEVAPSTLNIQSQGQVVTVHTSIAYSSVTGASVTLNGIPIDWWKYDNQGNFVAKFDMSEVKNLFLEGGLDLGENELTLEGKKMDGEEFTGSCMITVINNFPSGGK